MDSTVYRLASEIQHLVRSSPTSRGVKITKVQLPPYHLSRHGVQSLKSGWILVGTNTGGIADSTAMPIAMLSNAGPARSRLGAAYWDSAPVHLVVSWSVG